MTAPLPVVHVLKVYVHRGMRLVVVRCPFCKRGKHVHGWPWDHAVVGVRLSHCHRPKGEPVRLYRIEVGAKVAELFRPITSAPAPDPSPHPEPDALPDEGTP